MARALILVGLSIAPMRVPAWRLDPAPPPAVVLAVGMPVRRLGPQTR
jgi:hypothetical protein